MINADFLSKKQQAVLEKYQKEGTANFTRNDYDLLARVKKKCVEQIKSGDSAKEILVLLNE